MQGIDTAPSHHEQTEAARELVELASARQQLSADLDAMTRLHRLSTRFIREDLTAVLQEVVDAAIAITEADTGNVQLLDPATGHLKIAAHRGHEKWWMDFFETVPEGKGASCGEALAQKTRVVVEDVTTSPVFVGTAALDVQLRAGVRAVQSTPLLDSSGALVGMVSTHWRRLHRPDERALRFLDLLARQTADMVERARTQEALRASEERLRKSNAALREADRRKDRFLAVLSHELRNPLTPIRNAVALLRRAAGPDKTQHAIEVIDRQTEQLARLVDDLLDVARITEGKVRLDKRVVNMADVVRRTVDDHRGLFAPKNVRVEYEECAQPSVEVDVTRLVQVVGNLLQNASKFTGNHGHVFVTLDAVENAARLRVRDDGTGMATDTVANLFRPFVQAETTLDRTRGGLGLGLALAKNLIEMHGGIIQASSEGTGRGSEFVITLPVARQQGRTSATG